MHSNVQRLLTEQFVQYMFDNIYIVSVLQSESKLSFFLGDAKNGECPERGQLCFGKHKELLLWWECMQTFQ